MSISVIWESSRKLAN